MNEEREKVATDFVMASDFPKQVKIDLLVCLTLIAQEIYQSSAHAVRALDELCDTCA